MEKQSKDSFSIKKLWYTFANYGSIDIWFLITVLALLCIGLVSMFSAGYPYAMSKYGDSTYFIRRQAFFAVIGLVVMYITSRVKIEIWKKFVWLVCGISTFLLLIVFVLPQYRAGFYRWINLGFTTFQPSEIAKFAVIVAGAYFYSKYAKKMSSSRPSKLSIPSKINQKLGAGIVRESWVPTWLFCGYFGATAVLVFLENHLSGCILIMAIGVVMMFLGGVRKRWFIAGISAVLALVLVICVPIYVDIKKEDAAKAAAEEQGIEYVEEDNDDERIGFLKKYQAVRIISWLDKDYNPTGERWQTNQALYAIGSGGLFGKGLGNSTQKYMYVSEPQNDMIFSIVCEELGFVGAVIIIGLFLLLVYRGVVIGLSAKTRFGSLMAMGLVFQVGLQVVLNIAVATDSMPNTGISLPFFSYGGTSLVMLLAEMGIVLSVSRTGKINKK